MGLLRNKSKFDFSILVYDKKTKIGLVCDRLLFHDNFNVKIKQPFLLWLQLVWVKKKNRILDKADTNIPSDALAGAGKKLIAPGEKVKEEDKKQLTGGSE